MRVRLGRYAPIVRWFPKYTPTLFVNDALAAAVVTLLLIPQALAYALLAGMPAQTGLYASILPLLAYAVLGTSRTLAVGPFAVVSIMTATAVNQVVAQTGLDYISVAVLLALLSGMMLIALGILRLGFLINLLSRPVISGFIAASGILIAASQFGQMLGMPVQGQTLWALAQRLWELYGEFDRGTLAIGLSSLATLICLKRYLYPLLILIGLSDTASRLMARSGPIVIIVVSIWLSVRWQLSEHGVAVIGRVASGLPELALPHITWQALESSWSAALLISIVAFAESVSMAQTLANRRGERIDPDQELIGLGAANMASAFSGAFPVSASLSRSAVNDEAGAATPAAGAMTALGVALAALFLMPLISQLPRVVLAVIIIHAVASLVNPSSFVRAWRYSRNDGVAQIATFLLTLLAGVTNGLILGVVLSLVMYLYRTTLPHTAIVGRLPGTEHFRNVRRHRVETRSRLAILRIDESLYFGNARFLEDTVAQVVAEQPMLRDLVLMCPAVNYIDISAIDSLELIQKRLHDGHICLHLAEVKGPVMDQLKKTEFLEKINGRVFLSTYAAWKELQADEPESGRRSAHS
ncbi:SulP family inorganic anion transporter [Salinisphaera aquimarina]|uniref:SulP family inorganic anion transporter n=1 Tax=Salinisphaera aquimarina TaxID=2094031 RepID=A0ABV7EQY3_9GAMM